MVSRKEWNKLADNFEREVCDITRETNDSTIERLVTALKVPSDSAVLVDLGCGLGTFVKRYGFLFAQIYAVEHAPRIMARARLRAQGMKHITWITSNIPPAVRRIGQRSDLTVCMNVITMDHARTRERMWRGLAEVTKRFGHALIVVPSIESDRMVERIAYGTTLAAAKAQAPGGLVDRGGTRQKHFARNELLDVLERHGFRAKRVLRISYPWAKEGLTKPRNAGLRKPFDWLVLAQRI